MRDFSCYLITHRHEFYEPLQKSIHPHKLNLFDGTNIASFASLVNSCVEQCPTEIIVMFSYKARPTAANIEKIVSLVKEGYGLVALKRFACFGFKKDLFRKMGPLDESFKNGGYEDIDFYIRLREADISIYQEDLVFYEPGRSSYDYSKNYVYFNEKWDITLNSVKRKIPEPSTTRRFGKYKGAVFLPWDSSYLQKPFKFRYALRLKDN